MVSLPGNLTQKMIDLLLSELTRLGGAKVTEGAGEKGGVEDVPIILLRLHHTLIEAQWSGTSPELDDVGALLSKLTLMEHYFRSSRCRSTLSTFTGRSTTVGVMEMEWWERWRHRASEADFCPAKAPGRRGVSPSGNRQLHPFASFWSDKQEERKEKGGPSGG